MHVRCPHCHNPTEVVDDAQLSDISCPSCGSAFSLIGDDTTGTFWPEARKIGHFDLVETLGMGRFGTVWKARDTELDRTVAVKIPRKEQLDPREAEQFFREARAAAQLKHAGIVTVHEVGRERETIYIVSDYIHGANLQEWLTAQKLTLREAAELTVKIAAALHHAHEAGVVHRDLKPGNILIDADGEPHIADFGLAKRESGEITMTVDGHILGTPAYMPPEQAKGKGHESDARSDIYSLGVILYELTTGELPFRGEKRMLLLQIEQDEPPSPRKLNSRIPRDLETITLKCLEKEPARRYETAQQLSDDLKRHLAGEPIHARPVGRAERAWRWCKRQPVVASLSTAVAVSLITGTAVSSYYAIEAAQRAREAIAEKGRADENALEATANANRATKALAKEAAQRQRTDEALEKEAAQRKLAEANFQQARQAVDRYFTGVSENRLLNEPGLQPLRKELLETALEFYQGFIEQRTDDPEVQAELAAAYFRVGNITHVIGSIPAAKEAYEKAIAIWEQLVEENPTVLEYQDKLARGYNSLGHLQYLTNQLEQTASSYEKAIAIWKRLVHENPTVDEYQQELARSYFYVGSLPRRTGEPEQRSSLYEQAIAIEKRLVEENPTVSEYQYDLARSYVNLGRLQRDTAEKAAQLYEKAIVIYERLVQKNPAVDKYKNFLAVGYVSLGERQKVTDQLEEAAQLCEKAIVIWERLVQENPTVGKYQQDLASSYTSLCVLQLQTGQLEQAASSSEKAITIGERLVQKNPAVTDYQDGLRDSRRWLLFVGILRGKGDAAVNLEDSQAEFKRMPFDALNQLSLGGAHYRVGKYEKAIPYLKTGVRLEQFAVSLKQQSQQSADRYTAVGLLFIAMSHHQLGDRDEAQKVLEQSNELIEQLAADNADAMPNYIRREAEALIRGDGETPADQDETVTPPDGQK